jgi:hypothetical protein
MAKHTGKENIKMDLKEISWKCVDCINLTEDTDQWWALVSMVMNCWVS